MKKYVRINNADRRFEANFNAIGHALQLLGMDDLNGLADISGMKPSTFPVLFSCCLNEGARIDGAEFRISPEETGALPFPVISEMLEAFVSQNTPEVAPSDSKKVREAEKR